MVVLHGRTHRLCRQRVASSRDSLVAAGLLGSSRALSELSFELAGGVAGSVVGPTLCVQKSQNKSCFRAWDMYKLPRLRTLARFLSMYRESAQSHSDRDSYLLNLCTT